MGGPLLLSFPGKEPPHKEFLGSDPNWGDLEGNSLCLCVFFALEPLSIRGDGPLKSEKGPLRRGNAPFRPMGCFWVLCYGGKQSLSKAHAEVYEFHGEVPLTLQLSPPRVSR